MNKSKTAVVIGAGPGLGNHIATEFAIHGFHVILVARSADKLATYKKEMETQGLCVDILPADAGDFSSLTKTFDEIESQWGFIDVVIHNAANTRPETALPSAETLVARFQTEVASAMQCAQRLRKESNSGRKPCLLLTGGGLAVYPVGTFTALSVDKAALRALAYCLHDQLRTEDIFVGTVTICGSIGSDNLFAPETIAKKFWELYLTRAQCEIVYAYPNLTQNDFCCSTHSAEYWQKVANSQSQVTKQ